ncbi:MAG: transketolase, partial [Pseudomonadota bacterium]
HEAGALAGHLGLGRLIVLFDDNGITIDGPTKLTTSEDVEARFAAYGWHVCSIDGHDSREITQALTLAKADSRPSLIACKTHIGFGAPTKQDTAKAHGAPLGEVEIAGARKNLDWPYGPFEIPDEIQKNWYQNGRRAQKQYEEWKRAFADLELSKRQGFEDALNGKLPKNWDEALYQYQKELIKSKPAMATRVASQRVLEKIIPKLDYLIGGSADLTGSNNTQIAGQQAICRDDFTGQYLFYGIREHAMAAIMNGLQLYGGFRCYGGTFLVFSDYARPAIRLACLMKLPVIYVMTHDSIGLGEDGPTHQPVEHLASLRAIPNLDVMRPGDAIETAECWQLAIENTSNPTLLALSRQSLDFFRSQIDQNYSAKGGYLVKESTRRDITLIATGSEVSLALKAADRLKEEEIEASVVSMPSLTRFLAQDDAWKNKILGNKDSARIVIEAGIKQGWGDVLGYNGDFIGMSGFGASAPIKDLYQHFDITLENIVAHAKKRLNKT